MARENEQAKGLFAGIASGYDRWAALFSLWQYRRWHAALGAALAPRPGELILDVCSGTGAVAFDLAAHGCRVVGLDLSRPMLSEAQRRAARRAPGKPGPRFVEGRAEALPFPAATFDAVSFTFLLRYVADPAVPLAEIARVVRPGGRVAMLEFGLPPSPAVRPLWSLYVHVLLPLLTRPVAPAWAEVGGFLGPSIGDFYRRYPLDRLVAAWRRAGLAQIRCQRLSLGGAIVVAGVKS